MSQEQNHLSIEQIEFLIETQLGVPESHAQSELLGEMRLHLATCKVCQRLVSMHEQSSRALEQLRQGVPKDGTSDCPEEHSLHELAAGVVNPMEAEQLLKHVSQCDHCGPLLRQASEAFSPEKRDEEDTVLSSLRSSRTEWQESLARRLAAESTSARPTPTSTTRLETATGFWTLLRNPWVYAGAAAIALCAIATALLLLRSRPSYANQLLAQAYTEHRTLEVRIPGAKYSPMRVERGPGTSSLDKPASLLKAETLIVEKLRKNPNDSTWLEAKARADLLDGNYESAIKSLQRALEMQPLSPELLTDLGSAYFLRAEVADRATDYGNAIESFGRSLASSPDDPVALFNHALACERMFLYTQAVNDWEHYLRVDPTGDWASDARANLDRVKQKMAEKAKRTAAPLLSPKDFAAAINANHDDALASLDQRAEEYLEIALRSWLPQSYEDSRSSQATAIEARRALEYLADALEKRHDDTWLVDFLQRPSSPTQEKALRTLLAGDTDLRDGLYGLSEELSRKSGRDFQRSENQAGMLRASFALMLAQSFALKYTDCLRTAKAVIPLLATTHYRWLQTQVLIQQGECQDALAQEEDAIQSALRGAEKAKRFHYPGLELRALAFEAAYRRDTANADKGLHDLIDGLSTYWRTNATSTRGENLYSVLFDVAGTRNWHQVEELSIAEKIIDFPSKDPVDRAVGWELLAGAKERAGDYKGAQAALRSATTQLSSLPKDSGTVLRKGEILLKSASIQLQLGDPGGALAALAELRQEFDAADSGLFKAEYFKTYGEAYLAQGLYESAEPLLARALSISETGLRGLALEADKLEWSRIEGQIYRDLLEVRLKSGNSAEALALWEWYKSASLRSVALKDIKVVAEGGGHSFRPPEVSSYVLPPGMALVSYVALESSVTAFVFRDGNVLIHVLKVPDGPSLHAFRFLNLCADPSTDFGSFKAESRRLYEILVSPVEKDIEGATALQFETDGILDRIPFDLLQGADGRYLADRFEVSYSPGLAYRSQLKPENITPASSVLVVVASGSQDPSMAPLPGADDEGMDVSSYFREAKTLSGSQTTRTNVLQSLGEASLFHFVGHAVAGIGQVGLLLGPDTTFNSRDFVNLRARHLRLVVLSACETANGAEGASTDINSLARTLAVAGVPQTIASRWKVDSMVTRQLMQAFYSNLVLGKTPAESLRAATVVVRSLPGYEHPYYWGSFAVFGSS